MAELIFIDSGKGSKDWYILFPSDFRLALQTYMEAHEDNDYLFESRLKQSYTPRRVQQIMRMYADKAGLTRAVHPHLLRHQMLTFLTAQGSLMPKSNSYLAMGTEQASSCTSIFRWPPLRATTKKLFAI